MYAELPPTVPFAIVAYDKNHAIGHDDAMPYDPWQQLRSDNQRMWSILTNADHPISLIGGRKTMEPLLPLLLGKGIDDIIVLSRADKSSVSTNANIHYAHSPEEAFRLAKHTPAIFGGAEIYKLMLPYVQQVLATEVHAAFTPVNKYFPLLSSEEWDETSREPMHRGSYDAFDADFVTYQKRV